MVIKGEIDEIRYRNEENGFTIVVLDVDGDPVVCKGLFPPVVEGQTLSLDGKFVIHPKFGKQFDVSKAEICTSASVDSIVRFLGSGVIKGVGPERALRIVAMFGEKTFEVMEHAPHLLAKVKGISKKSAASIGEQYANIRVTQEAIMFLQKYGVTVNTALKIYKVYGKDTVDIISANPFILVEDVDGIGFLTADKIAQSMGIAKDSDFRLRAGALYTLKESVYSSGNTYLPIGELVRIASELLDCDEERMQEIVASLVTTRRVKIVDTEEGESVMLINVYKTEMESADRTVKLVTNQAFSEIDVSDEIAQFEKLNSITFHETQKQAIKLALSNGAVIITGGPGTGKTTIIKCILHIYANMNKSVVCMAPTGRAAKRMSEATGQEAKTIHRALGLTPDTERDSGEPLDCDVVIVDEFSMVDVFLYKTLLSRIVDGTQLVMVGDKDQLPSVGAGNVLADLIKSGLVPFVALTHIYRQSAQSLIVSNAHLINAGQMPTLSNKSDDFFFMKVDTPEKIADTIVDVASRRIPKFLNVSPHNVQVLCPLKNGVAGVLNMNKMLRNSINPDRLEEITCEEYSFSVGDKVMHTVNNYDLEWKIVQGYLVTDGVGVFNGDIGTVKSVNVPRRELEVEFEDGRVALYSGETLGELMLAYSITVHKSQGSEFDAIVMPLVSGSPMILTKNLLYTAITRAKRAVVLVGDEYNLKRMVNNTYVAKRYSALDLFMRTITKKRGVLFGLPDVDEDEINRNFEEDFS